MLHSTHCFLPSIHTPDSCFAFPKPTHHKQSLLFFPCSTKRKFSLQVAANETALFLHPLPPLCSCVGRLRFHSWWCYGWRVESYQGFERSSCGRDCAICNREFNKQSKAHLELENIVKGETQIVDGINYQLLLTVKGEDNNKYEAIVLEKPWKHLKNLTSFKPINAAGRDIVPGGWSPIKDLKDRHVVEIAQFAITEFNKQSKAHLKLQSIIKGKTQVVAGINYRLVLTVKGEDNNKYEAIVWEKPWKHLKNLTSFKPLNAAGHGIVPGGWNQLKDLKDPHVIEIAQFAVTEFNKQSKKHLELQSIIKGETQVVAGINYRLVLTVKGEKNNKYEAIVWEKQWEHFKNLTSFKPINDDGHGTVPGGWSPIKDLKDPHVTEIAQFAIREFDRQSKTHLELQSIIKGEPQVVAGINYRLLLLVKGGKSSKYEAIVLEKSWEDFKTLTSFKPIKP